MSELVTPQELLDAAVKLLYATMTHCWTFNEYGGLCSECDETVAWLETHGYPKPEGWPE